MSGKVKICMSLGTTFAGSMIKDVEYIDREEWDEMSEKERDKLVDEIYLQFISDKNYGGVQVIE